MSVRNYKINYNLYEMSTEDKIKPKRTTTSHGLVI